MRILLTTDTVGGVWTFTLDLTEGLLASGHSVGLLALGRGPSAAQLAWADAQAQKNAATFKVLFSAAPLEWMQENACAYSDGAEVLQRFAEAFQPELLHSSQFCFGALDVPYPKLVTAHSDVLSWADACRPGGFASSLWLDTYVTLVDTGLRGANAVTAPTTWMLRALQEHYQELPARQTVIFNGRTLVAGADRSVRKQQAITVGRLWDEGKNVRMLANVNSPWPLLIAGEQVLGEASADLIPTKATFLGSLSGDELYRMFSESSTYICTSIYEPFGLAPLEAALSGCALLLNDLPSLREVWGDAALYFRNADELSGLLERFASRPKHLYAAQQNARERALHFPADTMVRAYVALYEQLVAEHGYGSTREPALHAA